MRLQLNHGLLPCLLNFLVFDLYRPSFNFFMHTCYLSRSNKNFFQLSYRLSTVSCATLDKFLKILFILKSDVYSSLRSGFHFDLIYLFVQYILLSTLLSDIMYHINVSEHDINKHTGQCTSDIELSNTSI